MNIFVAKLNFSTNSGDLQEAFEAFGNVSSAAVIMDKYTGKSRGFGFVEMEDENQALNAIRDLNDSELDGKRIVVKEAKPRNNGQ